MANHLKSGIIPVNPDNLGSMTISDILIKSWQSKNTLPKVPTKPIFSGSEGLANKFIHFWKSFELQNCSKSVSSMSPRRDALKSGISGVLKKDPTEIAYEFGE